jgi:lipopolysaccharide biosynthesis glycosyltransferase
MQEKNIGAYFLANDLIYDWVISFLESFREFNPSLKLFLIPFDNNYSNLKSLGKKFNFEIFEEDFIFKRLEIIGKQLETGYTTTSPYWFRRFASFWGPLDRFIYLDSRIVVLNNLEPLIKAIDTYNCDFLHFEGGLDQVYNLGYLRESLVIEKKAQGFNSGKWISRKNLFSVEFIEQMSCFLVENRPQFNARNTDQFFLNYLIHSSNVKSASIHDLIPHLSRLTWPPMPGSIYRENGIYKTWSYGMSEHKKEIILIHWAGIKESSIMPRRHIFLKYRLKSEPLYLKLKILILDLLLKPILWFYIRLKSNRIVNMWYHKYS